MATSTDYLVIGAGPAGLQLGYFLQRAGHDYLILEAGPGAGTFFATFPRHRRLLSINKPHTGSDDPELNLRMDWNSLLSDHEELRFTRYTDRYFPAAGDMIRYLGDYAETLGLSVRYHTRVTKVSKDKVFRVLDDRGEVFEAPDLIVATGLSRPYLPGIPGGELAEQYGTVTLDPKDFTGQRVLIIGTGDSASETAENLIATAALIHVVGPTPIRFAWQSHYAGLISVIDGAVLGIRRQGRGFVASISLAEVTTEIPYDRVIACTGFRFDAAIFGDGCRPELMLGNRFPAQNSAWESTNVPGLSFAGTLMQVRGFNHAMSGSISGFRYSVRALHRILERRNHGIEWPHVTYPAAANVLANAIIKRAGRSSALWQQSGLLGDLIVLGGKQAAYYEEVPAGYAHDWALADEYLTITLEHEEAAYLHPVVRHFQRGAFLAEHHVADNLEHDWTNEETHRKPLTEFLTERLLQAILTAI